MKVLVCGSRSYGEPKYHSQETCVRHIERMHYELNRIHEKTPITLIIEGEAKGADLMARRWAERRGIPVSPHKADWKKNNKGAGPIRNTEMLTEEPDLVVAFTDKPLFASKGTQDMIRKSIKARVKVDIHEVVTRI